MVDLLCAIHNIYLSGLMLVFFYTIMDINIG